MPRKRKYKPKPFESTGQSNDTSANIYESMLLSPAFKDLTKNQRLLYVYMKAQYYGKRKPGRDFTDIEALQDDKLFYFNFALAKKYGLYSSDGSKGRFYDDITALEDHGFITTLVNGKSNHRRSIYRYSTDWQEWDSS